MCGSCFHGASLLGKWEGRTTVDKWSIWPGKKLRLKWQWFWWECKLVQPPMEERMEVPYKTKTRDAIWFCNPSPGHIAIQNYNSKRLCTVDSFLKKLILLRHLSIIDAQLIYSVLASAVLQVIQSYLRIHFFGILSHYGFSEGTEYSSCAIQ